MALWYDEVFDDSMRLGLKVERTLFMGHSEFQRVAVVETTLLGKALLLDDLWMTAEKDEKSYHEMIVHPAMTTAPKIERVLIIGGGDGGTAREVLRYADVEHVDLVEIDEMVVKACQEHLPEIGSAWDDERLNVVIGDGIEWAKRTDLEPYDVIIIDGSDPVGPAEGLFDRAFYEGCANLLSDDGVFVTQSESPLIFRDVHIDMVRVMKDVFDQVHPYYGSVMIYAGGPWSWTYASKGVSPKEIIDERVGFIQEQTEIYNRDVHLGAFAVPNHIRREL
ncbi:polyamine aminopropyltransferase [Persicimonas caeni]|uniref:Polyamine aminopropyltransferase n=1 Tax=Persicimonas caeni TaxID=2292766 RepID=A0A4Y6PZ81_PERCE|nr:polyamine aminopropyltransferase [Persicimonas caeni]QDG53573.1 polyamine aminopropyltransferase [Persicimonas caeni]QED34794.1 polyamine aminopropyltransferase [Persicimonas caeni]